MNLKILLHVQYNLERTENTCMKEKKTDVVRS